MVGVGIGGVVSLAVPLISRCSPDVREFLFVMLSVWLLQSSMEELGALMKVEGGGTARAKFDMGLPRRTACSEVVVREIVGEGAEREALM